MEEGIKVASQSELLADEKDNILGKRGFRHGGLERRQEDGVFGLAALLWPRPPQGCRALGPRAESGKPACSWRRANQFAVVRSVVSCRASSWGAQAT